MDIQTFYRTYRSAFLARLPQAKSFKIDDSNTNNQKPVWFWINAPDQTEEDHREMLNEEDSVVSAFKQQLPPLPNKLIARDSPISANPMELTKRDSKRPSITSAGCFISQR